MNWPWILAWVATGYTALRAMMEVRRRQMAVSADGHDPQAKRIDAAEWAYARGDIDLAELERRIVMALRNEGPTVWPASQGISMAQLARVWAIPPHVGDITAQRLDGRVRTYTPADGWTVRDDNGMRTTAERR